MPYPLSAPNENPVSLSYPIVRRERPHPGAPLSLLEERDGYRYQASRPTRPVDSSRSSRPTTAPTPAYRAI